VTFLLDTNHVIALLNGDPSIAVQLASHRGTGDDFAISTTVLGELYFGAYASKRAADNIAALTDLAAQLGLYQFDATAAEEFGKIKAAQRAKGKPIPTADAQIAAVARSHDLTVLTNDAHFQLIDGVSTDNWLL